jgi:hypothetical protein
MAEDIAVMHSRTAAKATHCIPELRVDERVHDHRRVSSRAPDSALEIVHRLSARVADLFELLVWELRFERLNEARSGLTG